MANNDAIIASALSRPRPGTTPKADPVPVADPVSVGLELSEIEYRPAKWFKENPANEVFRSLKSAQYLDDLEADIRAVGVTDPLIAMSDGLIIAGESRVLCARRIDEAMRLPVRLVLSDLSPEEQEKRLLLNNLLRFEIPEDTRLVLSRRAGIFEIPRTEAAEKLGKSLRQVKRDAAIVRDAEEIAAEKGRDEIAPEDVQAARDKRNGVRKATSTGNNKVITMLLPILSEMDAEGGACREYADKIRKVLG